MKYKNDVQEYAYLMHKTGYTYLQIRQYIKTQDYYFSMMDDDETVNEEDILDFLDEKTDLTKEQINILSKAQLTFLQDTVSTKEEYRMVKAMVNSFTDEEKEIMEDTFYLLAVNYEQII